MNLKKELKKVVKKFKLSKVRNTEKKKSRDTIREIDYKTLKELIKTNSRIKLVDVRSPQEFSEGRLNNAINIPLYELNKKAESILKDKGEPIILYCQAGSRSKKAYEILKQKGYIDLYTLQGGLDNIY